MGVLPTHYDTLRRALHATLRNQLGDAWTNTVNNAAGQSLNLITGVASGAADADQGPDWCDGTVIEHIRPGHNTITVRSIRVCRPGESN